MMRVITTVVMIMMMTMRMIALVLTRIPCSNSIKYKSIKEQWNQNIDESKEAV
ncbi:hypothetical protein D3C80_1882750 [compost metagenome]